VWQEAVIAHRLRTNRSQIALMKKEAPRPNGTDMGACGFVLPFAVIVGGEASMMCARTSQPFGQPSDTPFCGDSLKSGTVRSVPLPYSLFFVCVLSVWLVPTLTQ